MPTPPDLAPPDLPALDLAPEVVTALFAEASACHPREACGVILSGPAGQRFERFDNLQDRLHARDPDRYPRDARTAYALDPLRLQRLVDQAEAQGGALLAIAHSHPEHPAYLSATDRAAAAPFGAPTFPAAAQVVVSVYGGQVVQLRAFRWAGEGELGTWEEVPVRGLPVLPGPPPGAREHGEV